MLLRASRSFARELFQYLFKNFVRAIVFEPIERKMLSEEFAKRT